MSSSRVSRCAGTVARWILLLLVAAQSSPVYAYGGFVSSQAAPIQQSAENVVFIQHPDSKLSAIVGLQYAGPAQKFAWLVPVPGEPSVGISSNVALRRLDAATAPQYWLEVDVQGTCRERDEQAASPNGASTQGAPAVSADESSVITLDRGSVGPYDYVTLKVDAAQAALDWLSSNGYAQTGLDARVLRSYLGQGLNLLAFKLSAGNDAGAIRPVILTYEGQSPTLPLQLTASTAVADMGIHVWVLGPSQAVPDNYDSLVINDALIDWRSGQLFTAGTLPSGGVGPFGPSVVEPSNYESVVTAAADEAGGRGFVTELAGPASQFRDKIWSPTDEGNFANLSSVDYADGIDAILAANSHYAAWDGFREAVSGAVTLPDAVTLDDFARDPGSYRGQVEVDTNKFFELLEQKVVKPVSDTMELLYEAPYLTRLYTTMSPDEMTIDPVFDYNPDLAQISNVQIAKQSIACDPQLDPSEAPWQIELPQGGLVVGDGGGAWPLSEGSLPANLKVVMLSTSGSGEVLEDNSEAIGQSLFDAAGMMGSGSALSHAPVIGAQIGGTQNVIPYVPAEPKARSPRPARDTCGVVRAGAGSGPGHALWLALTGLLFWLRRRRARSCRDGWGDKCAIGGAE